METKYSFLEFPSEYKILEKNVVAYTANMAIETDGYYFRISETARVSINSPISLQYGYMFNDYPPKDKPYELVKYYYNNILGMVFLKDPYYYVNEYGYRFIIMQYYYNNGNEVIPLYSCVCYHRDTEIDICVEPHRKGDFSEKDITLIKNVLNSLQFKNK